MSTMYELRDSRQPIILDSSVVPIDDIKVIQSTVNDGSLVCIRQGNNLTGYHYNNTTFNWVLQWRQTVFNEGRNSVANYPWLTTNLLGTGKYDLVVLRNNEGIHFYQPEATNSVLKLLAQDSRFHDIHVSNSKFQWGRFYPDPSALGVMTRKKTEPVKFYSVSSKNFKPKGRFLLSDMKMNRHFTSEWTSNHTEFHLSRIQRDGPESFILRSPSGLGFYKFNASYSLEKYAETSHMAGSVHGRSNDERLFFANLTHQSYQDILQLNASGMFVFQHNETLRDYEPIQHMAEFSEQRGWMSDYTDSIQFLDLNGDGRDDLLYNGPRGITGLTMNPVTYSWTSLIDKSSLAVGNRYATVMKGIPSNSLLLTPPTILIHNRNQVRWTVLVPRSIMPNVTSEITCKADTASPVSNINFPDVVKKGTREKPVLLLRQQLDLSAMWNSVDDATGKLEFELNLIDLPNPLGLPIKRGITYQGSNTNSDLLGVGWSFPQDLITVDHQESVFPEDFRYQLISQNGIYQLKHNTTQSTQDYQSWQVTDRSDIDVKYHPDSERWEINAPDGTHVYGRPMRESEASPESVAYTLSWENWRGVGSDASAMTPLAYAWYLVEHRDRHGSYIRYHYDTVTSSVAEGKSFTRAVYLKRIEDQIGNTVEFTYAEKSVGEYSVRPLKDSEGNIKTRTRQTRHLTGYRLATRYFQQHINFRFQTTSGKRLLTSIEQEEDPTGRPVVEFAYKIIADNVVLEKMVLPKGNSVKFEHKVQSLSPLSVSQRYVVSAQAQISYGSSYIVVGDIISDRRQLMLRVLSQDSTEVLYSAEPDSFVPRISRIPLLGEEKVLDFEVNPSENFLAIVLHHHGKKELCVFDFIKGKMSTTPTYYKLHKETQVSLIKDSVIIVQKKPQPRIERMEMDVVSKKWNKTELQLVGSKLPLVAMFQHGLVTYDGKQLLIHYRDKDKKWHRKILKKDLNVFTTLQETVDKFDIKTDFQKTLVERFKINMLQVQGNVIVLRTWRVEGTQLFADIHLYLLNEQYSIYKENVVSFPKENLETYSIQLSGDGNDISIGYNVTDTKQFRLDVKAYSGKIFDGLEQEMNDALLHIKTEEHTNINKVKGLSLSKQEKADQIRLIEDSTKNDVKTIKDNVENVKKYIFETVKSDVKFCLDVSTYDVHVIPNGLMVGNQQLTFTGSQWINETIPEAKFKLEKISMPLGDEFVLDKSNAKGSSIKMFNQGENGQKQGAFILDLKIKSISQLKLKYPVYLAYQNEKKVVNVVPFRDEKTVHSAMTLPAGENLSSKSTTHVLVTDRSVGGNKTELILRPMLGLSKLMSNVVVTKMSKISDKTQRFTGFAYVQSTCKFIGDDVVYRNVSLIPASDKRVSGWIEKGVSLSQPRRNVRTIRNAKGEIVEESEPKEDETKKDSEQRRGDLMDRKNRLVIVDASPYSLEHEEVGYHGFEEYETIKIGNSTSSDNKWSFDSRRIIRDGFAMTGQNYLRLDGNADGKQLSGAFSPTDQQEDYVVSTWVRGDEMFVIANTSSILQVKVFTDDDQEVKSIDGEVKLNHDDWFNIEIHIDFSSIAQTGPVPKYKVEIKVQAPEKIFLDVDHIRFTPLNLPFEANSYDPASGKRTSVLQNNGMVKRHVLDEYHQEIARIHEMGQIVSFETYSKASWRSETNETMSSHLSLVPKRGFQESFSPTSFRSRWTIDNSSTWQVAPGLLRHSDKQSHRISLRDNSFSSDTGAIRLVYHLHSSSSSLKVQWQEDNITLRRKDKQTLLKSVSSDTYAVPVKGELVLLVTHTRIFVWIEGHLLFEAPHHIKYENGKRYCSALGDFALVAQDETDVFGLTLLDEPSVSVTHLNEWGQKIQQIVLEDGDTVSVKQTLYDKLDRPAIDTLWTRIERAPDERILKFHPLLVTNGDPYHPASVWDTGTLQGLADKLAPELEGYGYSRTQFADDPLSEKVAEGKPGKDFSVQGKYARKFSSHSGIAFLDNLFPAHRGFRQKVEHEANGSLDISVLDSKSHLVALYEHEAGGRHRLTTYDHDHNGNLVKQLPPLYHQEADTFSQSMSWDDHNKDLTESDVALQNAWKTSLSYNKDQRLEQKITPDSGTTNYMYTSEGLLRFEIHLNKAVETDSIVYYTYNALGDMIQTGSLNSSLTNHVLASLLDNSASLTDQQVFKESYNGEMEKVPLVRGRVQRVITFNKDEPLIEDLLFDADANIIWKQLHLTPLNNTVAFTNRYEAGRVVQLTYPVKVNGQVLNVRYRYNLQGHLSGIGLPDSPDNYASFEYNSQGMLVVETHRPATNETFAREYKYNPAGFLTRLEDRFLTEDVAYTGGSYGGIGHGDGTVTRTTFKADWHDSCDSQWLSLSAQDFVNEDTTYAQAQHCFQALKDTGYIDAENHPIKSYYHSLESRLPIVCNSGSRALHIANVLAEKGFPKVYGHAYDYCNHQELTKAKYFVSTEGESVSPLQPDSFAKEIPGINETESQEIWEILKETRHLIEDNNTGSSEMKHGKQGDNIYRSELRDDLSNLRYHYRVYLPTLWTMLSAHIGQRRTIVKKDIESMVLNDIKWLKGTKEQKSSKSKICDEIWSMLQEKSYVGEASNVSLLALNESFRKGLTEYAEHIPDIVRVLTQHFGRALGESPGDVESYDIDANGNHRHFYTGFNRYAMQYTNQTNQIHTLQRTAFSQPKRDNSFSMAHDSYGNVIQALHKGIQRIEYDAQSQRTSRIFMTDGRQLKFNYDALGERVLKQTRDARGEVVQETYYLRDGKGRCLVDIQVTDLGPTVNPDVRVTAYIYGPRGLIGFVRRDTYYSVITDHEGSVRLVVRDGEVVAAYDYLPYGQLLRQYGRDPDAHIAYRYTGQEFDAETGLYNYHARLYDPEIGRFFQVDPQEQYASPYKYAGNSPVALVDPDGEFAIMLSIIIISAVVSAYVGGASVNDKWNPVKWDYKSWKTYAGIGIGGFLGAIAPGAAATSFAYLSVTLALGTIKATVIIATTATVFSFTNTAVSQNDINPGNWNWTSPSTYNALLRGASTGAGLIGSVTSVGTFYKGLTSTTKKGLFIGTTTLSVGTTAYGFGVKNSKNGWEFNPADWDWKNSQTYWALATGALTGYSLPTTLATRGPEYSRKVMDGINSAGKNIIKGRNWVRSGVPSIARRTKQALRSKITSLHYASRSMRNSLQDARKSMYEALKSALENLRKNPNLRDLLKNPARRTNANPATADIEVNIVVRGSSSATRTTYTSGPGGRKAASGGRLKSVTHSDTPGLSGTPSGTSRATADNGIALTPNPPPNNAMGPPYDAASDKISKTFLSSGIEQRQHSPPYFPSVSVAETGGIFPETANTDDSLTNDAAHVKYAIDDSDACYDITESANCIISPIHAWNTVKRWETVLTVGPLAATGFTHRNARSIFDAEYLGVFNETKDKSTNLLTRRIPRDIYRSNHSVGQKVVGLDNDRPPTERFEDVFTSSATSSASRLLPSFLSPQHYLSDLGNILDSMGTLFSGASTPDNLSYPVDSVQVPGKTSSQQVTVDDCVPWAVAGGEYVAGITCNAKQSQTFVFPKDSLEYLPKPLEKPEDHFGNCRSIEWHGRPSVTCEGDATTLVHIPDQPRRLFDHVDGWLLLAQIAPGVYREAKSFFGFVTRVWTNEKDDEELVAISTEQKSEWQRDLKVIDELIVSLLSSSGVDDLSWAETMLEERRVDIATMNRKSEASRSDVALMAEQLRALREDVEEMIPVDVTGGDVPCHPEDNQDAKVRAKNYDVSPVVDQYSKTLLAYSYMSDKVGHVGLREVGF